MTQEQFERLKKYDLVFDIAVNAHYIRGMQSKFAADMIDVCRELSIYINPGCPACMLKAATTLGKIYFKYKEEQTTRAAEIPADADKADKADSSVLADEPIKADKAVLSIEPELPFDQEEPKTESKAPLAKSGKSKSKTNKTNKKTK